MYRAKHARSTGSRQAGQLAVPIMFWITSPLSSVLLGASIEYGHTHDIERVQPLTLQLWHVGATILIVSIILNLVLRRRNVRKGRIRTCAIWIALGIFGFAYLQYLSG
jgi:hypothetical protein